MSDEVHIKNEFDIFKWHSPSVVFSETNSYVVSSVRLKTVEFTGQTFETVELCSSSRADRTQLAGTAFGQNETLYHFETEARML
jgi:hypothetical protein